MSMKIIYTLIAKENNTVLCSSTEYSGNFKLISQALISQIRNYQSFHGLYNSYSFYYLLDNKVKYLCVTEGIPMDKAFNYLFEVKSQFNGQYSPNEIGNATPFQMLKFDSSLLKIASLFEEGRDSLLESRNSINAIDYLTVHEEQIEKFIIDFDELKQTMASKKPLLNNRKEFRLSVSDYIDLLHNNSQSLLRKFSILRLRISI